MQTIPYSSLALAFIPVAIVVGIYFRWFLGYANAMYAVLRMLIQLLLVGYVLTFIFKTEYATVVLAVVSIMVLAASWIALASLKIKRHAWLGYSLVSIVVGGGGTLALVTQGVLDLQPWYQPKFFIPLAGMIFLNAMNGVSLSAERWYVEVQRGADFVEARNFAFRAALLPITNSLFAVGLVSLPGMMTGQILSGVQPMVAVRYQIMVMCMVYGSAGISTAIFLTLLGRNMPSASGKTEH